ncbi:ras GEF [Clavulina sp. PMI_390]|nr:ras GEF [Clavulina sp. PMI_390]
MGLPKRRWPVNAINTAVASYQTSQATTSQTSQSTHSQPQTGRNSTSSSRSPLPSPVASSSMAQSRDSGSSHGRDDDGYESEPEVFYVQAMHDFESDATGVTCLSFKAGQIIRVYNQHETGWWDGECNGQRGWFPSNYVNTDIAPAKEEPRTYTSRTRSQPSSLASSARNSMDDGHGYPSQLHSLVQALSLLQNAVRARRITHFQPSTACVISCVRSVLSATDCLGRDSSPLMRFPKLASARKVVLSDLARLVAQTRKASEIDDPDSPEIDIEMEEMLKMADIVHQHVRGFLNIAADCGLEVPERRTVSPAVDEQYDRYLNSVPDYRPARGRGAPGYDDHDATTRAVYGGDATTSPNGSSAGTTRMKNGNLRRSQSRDSRTNEGSGNYPSAAAAIAAAYTRAVAEREQREASLRGSLPGPSTITLEDTPDEDAESEIVSSREGSEGSLHSAEGESDTDDRNMSRWPQGPTSTPEVLEIIRQTHDHLISTIAAFIGAVHSHTSNAHASSKGHLIEMTRETVDQVRALIALVDSVMATPDIAKFKARELLTLEACKSTLFGCTSSLVDSIRAITSLETSQGEDEQKDVCLQAATGGLRAGQDCVTSMKMCLARRRIEEPFVIFVLPPPGTATEAPAPQRESLYSNYSYTGYSDEDAAADAEADANKSYVDAAYDESPISDGLGPQLPSPFDVPIPDSRPFSLDEEEDPTVHVIPPSQPTVVTPSSSSDAETQSFTSAFDATPVAGTFPRSAPNIYVHHYDQEDSSADEKPGLEPETPVETDSDVPLSTHDSTTDDDTQLSAATTVESFPSLSTSTPREKDGPPQAQNPLVEKMRHGHLPSVPSTTSKLSIDLTIHSGRPSIDVGGSVTEGDPYAWLLGNDYDPKEISYNPDGGLIGGTLDALVEKMTTHRAPPDQNFARTFMLTFRLFTKPGDLLDRLITRFETKPPSDPVPTASDLRFWQDKKQLPVRVRVLNLLKLWLEGHWLAESDNEMLPRIQEFVEEKVIPAPILGPQGRRMMEIIEKRKVEKGDGVYHRLPRDQSSEHLDPTGGALEPPTPHLDRATLSRIRKNSASVALLDFDVLELARQLTIKEMRLYSAIRGDELLMLGMPKVGPSESIRAVTSLSTSMTGWVIECLLDEHNTSKRAKLLKFFILLADKCLFLHNFGSLRSIMAALDSSTISRLSKTWAAVSAKYHAIMDNLRKVVDHARNNAEYRARLRNAGPPAVPFLGVYLTDLTFAREGNRPERPSPLDPNVKLVNFARYATMCKIVADMQRFQKPFNLVEIDEIQRFLDNELGDLSKETDIDELYKRSLQVEPRQPGDRPTEKGNDIFNWSRLRIGGGS